MQLIYYDNWDNNNYELFLTQLNQLSDLKYLEFNKRIIFTKYEMLGIRTRIIRSIAKEISKKDFRGFLKQSFKGLYEEALLRGILISYIKNYDEFILYLDEFVKLIDNWAICDMCLSSYKIINKNRDVFILKIKDYLNSGNQYIVRIGIISLLDYYLVDDYIDYVFQLIDNIDYRAYYVDMAIAWLISVAFVKYQEKTIKFLDNNKLDKEIIRMSIQKIRDSLRVDKTMKDYVLKYK